MLATRRHSIIWTMCRGLTTAPDRTIRKAIVKIYGKFEGEIMFRRLHAAVNKVMFHLGHAPIYEGFLDWLCKQLVCKGILTRQPDIKHGSCDCFSGRAYRLGGSLFGCIGYCSGHYDQWKLVHYEMDPLHRLASAL